MAITRFRDEYYFLSNFYPTEVYFMGLTFKNSEAAFQSCKTDDMVEKLRFIEMTNPVVAKREGKKVKLREDWEQVKEQFMYLVVKAKFSQNLDLKSKLLETGNEELIEGNNHWDKYWGVCKGIGENKLGKILMSVREELREELQEAISFYKEVL